MFSLPIEYLSHCHKIYIFSRNLLSISNSTINYFSFNILSCVKRKKISLTLMNSRTFTKYFHYPKRWRWKLTICNWRYRENSSRHYYLLKESNVNFNFFYWLVFFITSLCCTGFQELKVFLFEISLFPQPCWRLLNINFYYKL